MKYLWIIATLFLLASCTWQVADHRTPADAAATRTARSAQPVSGNVGVLRVRIVDAPPVTVEPAVAPKASN